MTEKMIPVSVIDALIKELEELIKYYQTTKELFFKDQTIFDLKNILSKVDKEIKKEAIPSPEKPMHEQDKSVQEQGLEQKINDRIAFLEKELTYQMDNGKYLEETTALLILKLDELRKLLE